jgi:hypothetical protein
MLIRAQRPMKADAGECEAQEQPLLWTGAFYLSAGKQPLSPSGWRTTQLRWLECSQSRSRVHWQRQTLWGMLAKTTMHDNTHAWLRQQPVALQELVLKGVSCGVVAFTLIALNNCSQSLCYFEHLDKCFLRRVSNGHCAYCFAVIEPCLASGMRVDPLGHAGYFNCVRDTRSDDRH